MQSLFFMAHLWGMFLASMLERPCASQEGASMLLRREGGFLRREGGFLRRGRVAMLGGLLRHMLVDQGSTEIEPSLADYVFVFPNLIWPKPPGKARWKTRVKNIDERMALAQQGKWKTLLDLSMKLPLPTFEPTPEEELVDEHGLSKDMARKLHAAACQGQVGKAWKQMRSPPPSKITTEVWEEAKGKLKPHNDVPLIHRWMPKVGILP